MLSEFADGVFFVQLAPLTSSESVVPAIADALGVRERGSTPLQTTLSAYLRDLRILLLLDNFEHVLDTAVAMSELLTQCANLKMVATSRIALHLQSERIFNVVLLAVPEPGRDLTVNDVSQYGAVALFVDRARMALPEFSIDDSNLSAIVAICRRLDGLPLAIELAAARIRFRSTHDLLHLLDHRLAVLTGGANDLPRRHQTLRDTIAWSYRLLSDQDARLFGRLSVFSGGWTLRAAEALAASGIDAYVAVSTFNSLATLVDSNFVRTVSSPSGTTRYDMLETIREYGAEQLAARGESEEANDSHARFLLAFVEEQAIDRTGMNAALQGKRIEVEIENVRSALRWTLDCRDAVLSLSLCAALREFWGVRGYFSEGRSWLSAALALDGDTAASARVAALDAASWLACHQGELHTADGLDEEGLAISREQGDQISVARTLHSRGLVAQLRNDNQRARELYEQCIAIKRLLSRHEISRTPGDLAQVVFHQGSVDHAVELLEECMSVNRTTEDVVHLGLSMTDLAFILLVSDREAQATEFFKSALALHRDVGHVRMVTLQLSDELFISEWTAGRALSIDDAIGRTPALGVS